ncbi:hypothetical protein AV530_002083 [Patagioenas fasciata monilis]|uniref:Uncharacterized protein n=1 Tax=Patagioenas fasciata monilis TaxID=372326 RepID=A0A1V4J6N1_PATFA|nr:hypothetical protein AV530_002083 [Patagioenas fasciata monilis]
MKSNGITLCSADVEIVDRDLTVGDYCRLIVGYDFHKKNLALKEKNLRYPRTLNSNTAGGLYARAVWGRIRVENSGWGWAVDPPKQGLWTER